MGTRAMDADDYERRYMGADEASAISRARLGFGWNLLFVTTIVSAVAMMVLSMLVPKLHAIAWAEAVVAVLMSAIWLTAMVVRVVVTPEEVRIRHGLFGPSIALDDIVSVHAERHGFKRFLLGVGWGLGGKSLDGSYLYSTLGVARGLVIRYRTPKGISEAFVSSDDPESLIAAIDQARTRTRVAALTAATDDGELAEEEIEASADEATTRAAKARR